MVVHLRVNPILPEFSQTLRAALRSLETVRAEVLLARSALQRAR